MTEPQPRITICKWDDFQHYKDRTPPWIKLHRKLLTNREWRAIDGFSGRLLVELWLLASDKDHGPDGCVDLSTPDLAWTLRYDASEEGEIDRALQVLAEHGFVALRVNSASAAHTNARAEVEVETERETEREVETTPPKPPTNGPVVDNSTESTATIGEVVEAMNQHLGLGTWWKNELDTERRPSVRTFVMKQYDGRGVNLDRVKAAVAGVRILVDRGEVSWLADRKQKPLDGPGVMVKDVVIDGPDGSQLRPLFDVATDAFYAADPPMKAKSRTNGGPEPLSAEVEAILDRMRT